MLMFSRGARGGKAGVATAQPLVQGFGSGVGGRAQVRVKGWGLGVGVEEARLVMEREERRRRMQTFGVTLSPLFIRKYSASSGDSWVM